MVFGVATAALMSACPTAHARGGRGAPEAGGFSFPGKGKPSPPVYVMVEASGSGDPSTFQAALDAATNSLVPYAGHLLVKTGAPKALAGDPPKQIALIAFNNDTDVLIWSESSAVKAMFASASAANLKVFEIGGLPNAAIAFQTSSKGPDATFNTQPEGKANVAHPVSNSIKDICRGC